jgi:hypothetical protein
MPEVLWKDAMPLERKKGKWGFLDLHPEEVARQVPLSSERARFPCTNAKSVW